MTQESFENLAGVASAKKKEDREITVCRFTAKMKICNY